MSRHAASPTARFRTVKGTLLSEWWRIGGKRLGFHQRWIWSGSNSKLSPNMPAYIVATVTITDPDRFAVYARGIAGLNEKYGGEPIVKGAVTEVLEGDSKPGERVVVTRFANADAARAYIQCPEYQAASLHRRGAAHVVMRLIAD